MKFMGFINRFWSLNAVGTFGVAYPTACSYLLRQCDLGRWRKLFLVILHQIGVTLEVISMTFTALIRLWINVVFLFTRLHLYHAVIVIFINSGARTEEHLEHTSGHTLVTH